MAAGSLDITAESALAGQLKNSLELGWKDNIAQFSSAKGNGITEPVWTNMGNGMFNMLFTAGDALMSSHHIGHDYSEGTLAFPHVHWLSSTAPTVGQTVTWEISYVIARGHSQGESLTAATTTQTVVYTATGTEIAGEHMITEFPTGIDLLEPDTIVEIKTKLVSKTMTGNIFGIMSDLHYQSRVESTVSKVPDFNIAV